MASKQFHVMMFPWMAFGHMIPFLELSKHLAAKGIRISFISTQTNLQRLPSIPSLLVDNIKFVELSLPSVDGLPENCEATVDLQGEQIPYLKKACDGLKAPIENLIHKDPPHLILFDIIQCWIPETAAKFGVPCALFSAYSSSTLTFAGPPSELKSPNQRTKPEDFTVPPIWVPFPSLVSFRPDQAAEYFQHFYCPDITGMSTGQRVATTLEGCNFVSIRSCREFEGEYLSLLEELLRKPVLPVGLLPPSPRFGNNINHIDTNWSTTFNWLVKQTPKSVVFVGFGTEYKMPVEQVHELAYGLELSKLPFIWILRNPQGLSTSELLPSGFFDRISDRGMVSLGWAPQVEIMAHPAIGGCLFHAGWGSIIESLGFGHPQILMPMVADQNLNARLLVEKGIGLEVQRNPDGSFDRDAIAKSTRLVIVDREGEALRLKAAQMQGVFANQELHENYINHLIEFMGSYKKK
ncbi:UDP-glycosyltransferase 91C1-like [Corylus avellana]|uniref:UDP-glycosyltransferase 91C1-like n=1 Tax=Corylus avellana TaxID=13451 RepID=UPI001E2088E9|nr:UDP-glycosyltransferase 91C1-like [Corylus avellana]